MNSSWEKCAERVRDRRGSASFDIAIILGSGLGALTEELSEKAVLSYRDVPGMPSPCVAGHEGRLIAGLLEGWRVLVFQGRSHLYEGFSAREVTVPVRLAHALGAPRLLVTNAAGGVNESFRAGDFMYLTDHINLSGDNPLRGEKEDPFVDLSALYRQDLIAPLRGAIRNSGIRLQQGVLASLLGPSYETPAEIRMLRVLGADVVSMSTVHEAIMARYLGMEVVGLSFVANTGAGIGSEPLRHDEVLTAGRRGAPSFVMLVGNLLRVWRSAGGS